MLKQYVTSLGDMWDLIAKKTLGNEMQTDALIQANIKYRHTHIFPAGIVLTIPDIPTKSDNSLPPWKRGKNV